MKENKLLSKALSITVAIIVIFLNASVCSFSAATQNKRDKVYCKAKIEDDFVDNHVLIALDRKTSLEFKEYKATDFAEFNCTKVIDLTKDVGIIAKAKKNNSFDELIKNNPDVLENFDIVKSINLDNYRQILCLELQENSKENVLNVIKQLEKRNDLQCVSPDYIMHICSTTPNDSLYGDQEDIFELINLPDAWDETTGSSLVTVGVIDTGIYAAHDDLVNVVDVYSSRNFHYGNCVTVTAYEDYLGHGTEVAGIIGAQGNNNLGVCGVCWNVKIVSLIVFKSDKTGNSSDAINAINYATSIGIPILNMSGGWGPLSTGYNPVMEIAITLYPGIFICAAGNDGENNDINNYYPTNYSLPNLISVASSDINDVKGAMSNYGQTTVDLFAPGEYVKTTGLPNTYVYDAGTSMATPFVTGVAALLKSLYPSMKPCEIKDTILSNVDTVTSLNGYCVTGGRLNAYAAISNPVYHSIVPNSYYNIDDVNVHRVTCYSSNIGTHYIYEPHSWVSVMLPGNIILPNYIPAYECNKCGLIVPTVMW